MAPKLTENINILSLDCEWEDIILRNYCLMLGMGASKTSTLINRNKFTCTKSIPCVLTFNFFSLKRHFYNN